MRQGVEQGQVTAVFEVAPRPSGARAARRPTTSPAEDELILRRVQFADGRTRAFVNDQPVSVQVLKQLGSALVEIHGQHDERALVDAATHRRLLDAFGGLESGRGEGRSAVGGAARGAKPRPMPIAPRSSAPSARATGCAMPSTNSTSLRRRPARRPRSPTGAPR